MTRPLLVIFLTIFVNLIGFGIIIPLLPFYAETFGASPLVIGLLFAVFSVCQLVAAPILGDWSDRVAKTLTDRLGLVSDENALDYRQFRLSGTRDYGAKIEKCVTVAEDGVTLRVDAVVCPVRTVASPIKRESCSLVSILLGVKATFVSQLLVIDSLCP